MRKTATAPAPPTAHEAVSTGAAIPVLDEQFARLPLAALFESPHNPRRHFDPRKLAELTTSIRERGIIEPLVVRPAADAHGAARYEIVAGARRYRAATAAGLAEVPALVRAYSDEAVLELVLIENVQRDDLTPLEQAAGFRVLRASNPDKHTLTWIATHVGKSEAWVWDRMKLLDLVPEAQALLAQERITVGHAILLSRLKATDQVRAIAPTANRFGGSRDGLWQWDSGRLEMEETDAPAAKKDKYAGLKPVSIRELETWIRDQVRFDVAHAAQAQPLVFAETATQVETAAAAPGRGKKVVAITHDHRVSDAARDDSERTYGRDSWVRADGQQKSKTCEHAVLGVIVAGVGYGQTLRVCVARETCRVHFGKIIAAREKAARLREKGQEVRAGRVEKKAADTWQAQERKREAERQAFEAFKPTALRAIAAKIRVRPFTNKDAAALLGHRSADEQFQECLGGPVTLKNLTKALEVDKIFNQSWSADQLARCATRHRVDLKALRTAHDASLATAAATGKARRVAKKGR